MFSTPVQVVSRPLVLSAAVAAILMTSAATVTPLTPVAHAATSGLHYQHGYSLQPAYGRIWLCYGWPDGAYRCTRWWRNGPRGPVSLNPRWVPVTAPVSHHAPSPANPRQVPPAQPRTAICQWCATGYAAWRPTTRAEAQGYWFGSCTWAAAYFSPVDVAGLGNAGQWASNARARGLRVGNWPEVGATAVFAPGVQGASALGHVAHVVAVYGNGWFLVAEMSFYWNGGGWGIVSYRYAHAGAGVSFIEP